MLTIYIYIYIFIKLVYSYPIYYSYSKYIYNLFDYLLILTQIKIGFDNQSRGG